MKLVIQANKLQGGVYVEPFAGGAGVAIALLLDGYVELYLNALHPDDHILIAHRVDTHIKTHWIVSYDNVEPIHALYLNTGKTLLL